MLNKKLNPNSLKGYSPGPIDTQAEFNREDGTSSGGGASSRGLQVGVAAVRTHPRQSYALIIKVVSAAEGQERKTESKLAELPRDVHEGDDAFQAIVSEGLYAFFIRHRPHWTHSGRTWRQRRL